MKIKRDGDLLPKIKSSQESVHEEKLVGFFMKSPEMIPDMKWLQTRQNVFVKGKDLEFWKEKDDATKRHKLLLISDPFIKMVSY